MRKQDLTTEISQYLKKIQKCGDICHLCGRNRKQILKAVKKIYSYDELIPEMLGDKVPVIMTYKLSRPVCAFCYNTIMDGTGLADEVRNSNPDNVWKGSKYLFKECYISDPLEPIQLKFDV